MRTDLMAENYVGQARSRLSTAKRALRERNYPYAIRQSQECVELSLKGALRLYGVEYPREHDIKSVLGEVADRFPPWFSQKVGRFSAISEQLARERGPSMYGDEEKGVPASELFKKGDAVRALEGAEMVYAYCAKLLRSFKAKRGR